MSKIPSPYDIEGVHRYMDLSKTERLEDEIHDLRSMFLKQVKTNDTLKAEVTRLERELEAYKNPVLVLPESEE